jgi:hypothetical protein
MGLLTSLFGARKRTATNPFGHVDVEELRIVYHGPRKKEEIAWKDLVEVGIVTTDEGPFQEDVYFLLLGPDKRMVARFRRARRAVKHLSNDCRPYRASTIIL